ncbi:MexH family multidrug efflux RND transporter periplasmic adaptor subunit [Vibrio alfacsensis]|uniref:efflux RND transporter periplasmic adaptor subunit n=1 Tax=Vibrio alfacsensis TaxID=1074311 RepID=UPI001BEDFAE7|nr:efflux RND transporter periplasmic adaptor subunit [Vibrio alfacsensis]BBM67503.1 MexH family multidrug efflux RND transporter periplasmic adaptor subunit [Vibrio alfacsensis]
MVLKKYKSKIITVLASIFVIGATLVISEKFQSNEKVNRKRTPKPHVRIVDTVQVNYVDMTPTISTNGVVKQKNKVSLRPEVKGTVKHIPFHLILGGFAKKGEPLVTIDSELHQLAVDEANAQLSKLKAAKQIEIGRQKSAEMEYQLSDTVLQAESLALLLREPHLKQIESDIAKAEASLKRAKLNLEKTTIYAPFNGKITAKQVEIGSMIKDNTNLMDLIATDAFWVQVNVTTKDLKWFDIPNKSTGTSRCLGSEAIVTTSNGTRKGCVVSMVPVLDNKIKTAKVMIEVIDPLAINNQDLTKLLVNDFVKVDIKGKPIKAIELDRRYIQDNEYVWVMNEQNLLEKRYINISIREKGTVLIEDGLFDGDRVITTSLLGAVEGIELKERKSKGIKK